ncbi:hypothetical protein [uncultured Nostoc sp.]|uniref:hypothetical protein n=1 Tax=uncultured Nostoc sp. TaxID=340711 RepID=UPI0035CC43DA
MSSQIIGGCGRLEASVTAQVAATNRIWASMRVRNNLSMGWRWNPPLPGMHRVSSNLFLLFS